ncbi:uncharacterized protein NEMAJ01_0216 [Nematocida major]|uniref:uncharacterized protein n=1 Tax=Nematocida major TaxID=1912982 RepID=UPI002007D167|nr:uncharacterized protein NEMAJ01_0216 [Nematocida major]KAH9385320.1 hypothetical protein NEMAJ01_0216 [Nematocida major]
MESHSYALAKKILDELENDLEGLYQTLSVCVKKEALVSPEVLLSIIVHKKALKPSKILALRLLSNVEAPEEVAEAAHLLSNIRSTFRISEIIKSELETSDEITENVAVILEVFSKMLVQLPQKARDTLVSSIEEAGIFILVNVWATGEVLRLYGGIFHEISPEDVKRARSQRKRESTPYRVPVEESVCGKSSILVHRREHAYFTPRYFCGHREVSSSAYERIFAFQDEYEVINKALFSWCNTNGDLKGLEWVLIWHINNLAVHTEAPTYEREIIFLLGPMFYSSITNFMEEASTRGVFKTYLGLIERCTSSANPTIRGASFVAVQRITSAHAKYFLQGISPKVARMERAVSVQGLEKVCRLLLEDFRPELRKTLEKEAVNILRLLEIQPEEGVAEHSACVVRVLSSLDSIPISLFSPSSMSLVLWAAENGGITDKKALEWIEKYTAETANVYDPESENILLRALGF